MARRNFSDGQEITLADLNAITKAVERGLFDSFLYRMLGSVGDAFFEGSFKVTRTSSTTVTVAAGLGFQYDSAQTSPEPTRRPLLLASASVETITTPDATNPRIDIISVKAELADELTESRRFKDADTDAISDEDMVVQKEWAADIVVTAGTPAGSPAAPSTPAGYIKIAELLVSASTGIAASGAVTDTRTLFNMAKPAGYDAVVGSGAHATHATLAEALLAASAGWKILVTASEAVAAVPTLTGINNVQIDFKPGVTISKSGATASGLAFDNCDGCRVNGGRFSGFNGGSDKAIAIAANCDYNFVRDTRFNGCTTEVDDLGTTSSVLGTITE